MFLDVRNEFYEETVVMPRCLEILAAALPDSWDLETVNHKDLGRSFPDAFVTIRPPAGSSVLLAIETKGTRLRTDAIAHLRSTFSDVPGIPCLLSEYFPPRTRELMAEVGFSGVDTTGWIHIVSDQPPILIDRQGAPRAPREPRKENIERLTGTSTARVLRYLVTASLPRGVREIADDCHVSPGTVSKLLPTFEREGIMPPRDRRGPVESINRKDLIDRWAQDYSLAKGNFRVESFLDPRGLQHAADALTRDDRTVLTGVHGGLAYLNESQTPVVSSKQLTAYCDNPQRIAREIGLYPVEKSKSNVVLIVPKDPELLQKTRYSERAGGWVAPLGQVLVDLKTFPGREADLANQIIDSLSELGSDSEYGWTMWSEKKEAKTK